MAQKTLKKKFKENCAICGDKGFGIHYSVPTCVPCKAFFKRNSWKKEVFKCNFDNSCKIDAITRKFCQSCRLKKCFTVGMKRECENTDEVNCHSNKEENNTYMKKQNRKSFDSTSCEDISSDTNTNDLDAILTEILDQNNASNRSISDAEISAEIMEIENYITLNTKMNFENQFNYTKRDGIIDSTTSDYSNDFIGFKDNFESDFIEELNIELKNFVSKPELAIISKEDRERVEEFKYLFVVRPITDYINNLNESEGMKLTELLNATNVLKQEYSVKRVIETNHYTIGFDIWFQKSENEVMNIVKMCKNLQGFKCLCEEDKIQLLKYTAPQIIFTRSIKDYDDQECQWKLVLNNGNSTTFRLELLRDWNTYIYRLKKNYMKKVAQEWDSDIVILDLLTVIALLNPNGQNLLHSDIIRYQQYAYMYLLQRYLQLRYRSENDAKSKFFRLMKCLQILQLVSKKCNQNINDNNPRHLGPLFKEIYNNN